jgi:NitT/TauT family transport system ATP-binding protein
MTTATATHFGAEHISKTLTKADGSELEVSRDISFGLQRGEFVSIVGPSGAGKTTLLRMLAGLLAPDTGKIVHDGETPDGVPPWLSLVFQDYGRSLFPWMTSERNVAQALHDKDRGEQSRLAREALRQVGLEDHAGTFPWELSGGMQQRVAIARAIASRPEVLLMDEPFASVDALTRGKLEDEVMRLWSELGFTGLLVTHDVSEAVYMSDRILVLSPRPSTIVAEVVVDLPRPRTHLHTRVTPRFNELYAEVLAYVTG